MADVSILVTGVMRRIAEGVAAVGRVWRGAWLPAARSFGPIPIWSSLLRSGISETTEKAGE